METNQYRRVFFYKTFFETFFVKQTKKVRNKIAWTLKLIEQIHFIPEVYLKHLENSDGLYEIRVQSGTDIFRIFCFFDEGNLIVVVNGFQKKTKKTPQNEIERASKIKKDYYETKNK